jgi:glycosyltransferase involved in cell wall biosynthesis
MTAAGPGPDVLFVVGTYPLLTTTFIDREIVSLRDLGVQVGVLAARRPDPTMALSAEQRELAQRVTYLLPARVTTVLASHATFLLRHPVRYCSLFARLMTARHPHVRARVKTVLHFGEGVVAAYLVRKRRPRELYAHFADRAATIALVASRVLGVPYSMSVHAGADIFVEPILLAEKLHGARCVVTCTAHNKARLADHVGSDIARVVQVFPHGVDVAKYRTTVSRIEDPPIVLSVGQLQPRKGLTHLVQACAALRDRGAAFRCRIVGTGPQHDELRRLIAALGLENVVELVGAASHECVIEHYREASIFVLTAIQAPDGDTDGFPNVIAEAMAAGLPVVSTALPAIQEFVVDGETGLLVAPASTTEIAAALVRLLDEPNLRAELGARARRSVAESFDVQINVGRLCRALWPDACAGAEVDRKEAM